MVPEVLSILFIQCFLMLDMLPALLLLLRFSFLAIIQFFLNFVELSFTTIQFLGSDSVYLNTFRIFEFRSMPFSFEKQQNLLHVLYITVDLQYLSLYYI